MTGKCKNCGREHDTLTFNAWAWGFSRYKPKPKGTAGGILFAAARLLHAQTGCGEFTNKQLAEMFEVSEDTVEKALEFGRNHKLFHRVSRGYGVEGEEPEPSRYRTLKPVLTRTDAGKDEHPKPARKRVRQGDPNPRTRGTKPAYEGDLTRTGTGLPKEPESHEKPPTKPGGRRYLTPEELRREVCAATGWPGEDYDRLLAALEAARHVNGDGRGLMYHRLQRHLADGEALETLRREHPDDDGAGTAPWDYPGYQETPAFGEDGPRERAPHQQPQEGQPT